jgi:hypothetical protein
MKYIKVMLIVAVVAMIFSGVSQARFAPPKKPLTEMNYQEQIHYWTWSVKYYRYICKESTSKEARRAHCHAWVWALRNKIHVQRQYLSSLMPPHNALWECVHRHEAGWYQADNATGRTYFGGLQMTYGWLGYIRGRASDLSPIQQKWAAERGFRDAGYSLSWLNGQWPGTTSECSAYV